MPKYVIDSSILKTATTKSASIEGILKTFKEDNKFLFETTNEEKKLTDIFAHFCNSNIIENEPGIFLLKLLL